MIALLACRMSIASLTLLFGFGTATTLDTHGVGPDIFSIMSFFSSSLILCHADKFDTFWFRAFLEKNSNI